MSKNKIKNEKNFSENLNEEKLNEENSNERNYHSDSTSEEYIYLKEELLSTYNKGTVLQNKKYKNIYCVNVVLVVLKVIHQLILILLKQLNVKNLVNF
jgi:hypothetical protein